jgi:hypothetical protein
MPRDHTRINLDIWGDDDWLDLPVDAQLLYLTLYTSPGRTYCGAHEWHVGKFCQRAQDWTPERVVAAAEVLSERLFLVIDEGTGECLLRSWIKHDGLWRTPNMAVTVANARAELASRTLRGVVVHEVRKLRENDENASSSWSREQVAAMLAQKPIDPASLPPFKGGGNPGPNGGLNPGSNPTVNPYSENGVNPTANPAPTTATATSLPTTSTKGGYVSTEGHQGDDPEPPRYCPEHPHDTNEHCADCIPLRKAHDAWKRNRDLWELDELDQARRRKAAEAQQSKDCLLCDEANWVLGSDGKPVDPARKCDHPEVRHA